MRGYGMKERTDEMGDGMRGMYEVGRKWETRWNERGVNEIKCNREQKQVINNRADNNDQEQQRPGNQSNETAARPQIVQKQSRLIKSLFGKQCWDGS